MSDPVIPFDYYDRLRRQSENREPVDPVSETLATMRANDARMTILESGSPDDVARVTKVARETGENPALVDGNTDLYEKSLQAQRFGKLAQDQPSVARWAAANPRGAAAAADDTKALGILGTAWDFLSNAPGRVWHSALPRFGSTVVNTWNTIEQFNEFMTSPIDAGMSALSRESGIRALDPEAALEMAAQRRAYQSTYWRDTADAGAKRNKGGNTISEGLLQGIDSIPMTAAALVTRNPEMAASVMGVLTAGSSYQTAKSKGLPTSAAIPYAVAQGGTEALTERIPVGTLVDLIARKTPVGKALIRELGQELVGENIATVVQDMTDWAYLPENRGKTLGDFVKERPQAALSTSLAVLGGSGTTVGVIGGVQRVADGAAKVADRRAEARRAKAEQGFLNDAEHAVADSKLHKRDPEAFRALVREQASDTGASHVFIPGEAIQAFRQSESYDPYDDPFEGKGWEEAAASGGDLVMPVEDFITDIIGSKAYAQIKDDVRLSQGGMSAREAQTFEDSMDETIGKVMGDMAQTDKAEAAARTVRETLVDKVSGKLGESFTSPVARQYAELAVQRAQTRAATLGMELTGNEFDTLDVRQIMPEAVAQAVQADHLDLVINAMRVGKDAKVGIGPSLLEFIRKRGGVYDGDPSGMFKGGDLKSMGLPARFIRKPKDGASGYGLDDTLRAAVEAGYFPELRGALDAAGPSQLDTNDLLAAISDELAGKKRFTEMRDDPQRAAGSELEQMLASMGLDPAGMTDAEVRQAVSQMAERPSNQAGYEQESRGRIIFDQNKRIIELFQSRNLSTLIHEFGHMWLEELRFDASLPEAPEQLKVDWITVKAWFAHAGHPLDENGNIPVDAHELFARGIETYVMEGKAPTPALVRIFENMRAWLVSIYRTVARLNAPISPEMREVFDRMLATDEEIAAVRERQGIDVLFEDAESIGMSEGEFTAYQSLADEAKADSHAKLLNKTMKAIRRRETERYREARKGVQAEQTERIDASPVFRALTAMKADRISKDWIVDRMGLDALDLLPKRVPPLYVEGGVNPDAVAEMAGYQSGTALIEALIGAEKAHRQMKEGGDQRSMRERAIETATDEEMNRRYGDPLNDGSIEREALAAVQSDMQGEVIAAEIRALGRKTGKGPTPYQATRDWARGKVRSGIVSENATPGSIQRFARNAAKAGRLAQEAMLKGDLEEAYRQKQFQMFNNALVAEGKAAFDDVEAAVKRMSKIADAHTRKSVDQDYLEQAQALLEQVDLRKRSQVYEKRKGQFAAWAQAREAEGYDVLVPDSFSETLGRTNWIKLPVETLLTLDETVKQIMHLGRLKQTLLDNQEQREWDAVIAEAVDGAGNIRGKPPADLAEPGWWDAVKNRVAGVDAALLKIETVFDWLDGGKSNGVFNRMAFRPIAEAQARENDMLHDYYGRIKSLFGAVPAKTLARWDDVMTPPFVDVHTGRPMRVNRKQLVAMALNVGNEGNLQRLADGYRVNPEAIIGYLDETLTAEEWAFVQGVWDTIDTLWPEIEGLERRVNGIAPEKIAPRQFTLGDGTVMKGGYYPAIYDSSRDYRAEENSGKESDLFEGRYTKATTRASATKERSEKVKRPILLDLGVINRHLGEVIHDITHREAVMQANRFLSSEPVRRAIDGALGREIGAQFRPWVKYVANSWAAERAGNEGFGRFLGKLQANVTAVGMGFRATTMVTQIAGYSNSAEVVGEAALAKAIARFTPNMAGSIKAVHAKSGEMRHRMGTLDRDLGAEISKLTASNPASRAARAMIDGKKFFFYGIGYMDMIVSVPTWMAAYDNALLAGMSEADAVYAADKAVRQSQGAGGAKDLAAIQRGTGKWGQALKLMTMFFSFYSAQYQRQRTFARDAMGEDARKARNVPRLAARAFFLVVLPPILTEVLRGFVGADSGPDDDEWWAQWLARKLLANSIGGIPLARDVFEPAWNAAAGNRVFAPSISPVSRALESWVKAVGSIAKEIRGDDAPHATKDVLEAVGYATGLVPGQVASATQFLVDVGAGDADPEGLGDWLQGLSTGKLDD